MILLGKNPGILNSNVNTKEPEPYQYLSNKVLEKAEILMPTQQKYSLAEISLSISSSSSSYDTSNNVSTTETTNDALQYIAGYIAKKFKDKYPELGDYTYKFQSEHQYNLPSWVEHLSYGGLIKPTGEWLQKI